MRRFDLKRGVVRELSRADHTTLRQFDEKARHGLANAADHEKVADYDRLLSDYVELLNKNKENEARISRLTEFRYPEPVHARRTSPSPAVERSNLISLDEKRARDARDFGRELAR